MDESMTSDPADDVPQLYLVLCESCTEEILQGDTIIWSECLLCSCRTMKQQMKLQADERSGMWE